MVDSPYEPRRRRLTSKPQSATSAALERQRRLLKGVDVNALEAADMSEDHAKLVEELAELWCGRRRQRLPTSVQGAGAATET